MKRVECILLAALMVGGFCSCKHKNKEYVPKPVKVEVMAVENTSSSLERTYVGEVEENASVALNFTAGGTIEQLLVHEGDKVSQGMLLATINKTNALNAYNSAKATLDQAEDGYKRMKQVYEQGSVAEVKWVEMLTNLEKARSMEAIAKKQLENCELHAPFSGIVGTCDAKVGANLLPGQTVLTLLDIQQVQVAFTIPEVEIENVEIGKQVRIEVHALQDEVFYGKINDRSTTANRVAHSYKAKVSLDNSKQRMLPGMVCKIYLSNENEHGIVIPSNCVQTRSQGLSIWKIKNGKAHQALIKSTQYVANGVLVKEGVCVGDTIVTAGYQKLYEGADITLE